MADEAILDKFRRINVNKSGERRSPHKPLLILLALANLQRDKKTLSFVDIEPKLKQLLKMYSPPTKRQQPELPFWHLATDGLWVVENASNLTRQKSGFPTRKALRTTVGYFPSDIYSALQSDTELFSSVTREILERHFPESLHEEILDAVGLDRSFTSNIATLEAPYERRRRDPGFREKVLRAYEHRCAVTGFRAALSGSYFGCEAAHVKWHAYNGPDSVDNGMALEPTLHKLFDAGAWTLSDDRIVLVSEEFTGTDATTARLRAYHGKSINAPLSGHDTLNADYIRWHREVDLGGVFRMPALPL